MDIFRLLIVLSLLIFYSIYRNEPKIFEKIINPIIPIINKNTETNKNYDSDTRQILDLWNSTKDFRKHLKKHKKHFNEISDKINIFITQINELKSNSHYSRQIYNLANDSANYILDMMSSLIVMISPSFSTEGKRNQILEDFWRGKIQLFSNLFNQILENRRQIINLEWKINPNIESSPIPDNNDPKPNMTQSYDYYSNFNLH
jgi:hypothetical protein